MKPHYSDDRVTLHHGDCLDVLAELDEASVHAIVTDPPYDLTAGKRGGTGVASINLDSPYGRSRIGTGNGAGGFMGKAWDGTGVAFDPATWRSMLRVLKPGGHLLAFGGTRTYHRLACAVEDAGFEIRDSITWLYGAGFPKSLNVSKAIDKAAGAEREVTSEGRPARRMIPGADQNRTGSWIKDDGREYTPTQTAPTTEEATRWSGWGTALKPAHEPIVVARKPLAGTVAANVAEHGTGALNIDGCRVASGADYHDLNVTQGGNHRHDTGLTEKTRHAAFTPATGRWPANVVLDEHTAALVDEQSGASVSRIGKPRGAGHGDGWGMTATGAEYDDSGGASRFFYVSKASVGERPRVKGVAHPTVKPLNLMRWLVRLVTPPGGTVLDPFAGSGTTAEACLLEGFNCIAVEAETDYLPLIIARVTKPMQVGFDLGMHA